MMCDFQAKMAHLPHMRFFFRKTINIISTYLLAPFIVKKKKNLWADPKLWGYTIFRPKTTCLAQKWIFSENPSVNFVAFIHLYVHAENQSQGLQLKNTEIWLEKSIFGHNFRTKFSQHMQNFYHISGFHRILKGDEYFHSTPFPDKTN